MKPRRPVLVVLVGTLLFAVVGVGCTLGVVSLLVSHISPRDLTVTNMYHTKRRILRYAAANDTLPTTAGQLTPMAGYVNDPNDAWGRPITWRADGDTVTLTSYGRDGKPGGTGEDEDLIGVFRAKTDEMRWADELCNWKRDPSPTRKRLHLTPPTP